MERRYIPGVTRDRRKRRGNDDLWGKILRWLGVVSWILMFTFLAVTEKMSTGADQLEAAASTTSYLATIIFVLMILGLGVSISGFMLMQKRNRRSSDEFTYSVLVLGLVSFCGIIYYIFVI